MGKIFKHMKPYWMSIVIVIALLFVQAWCDLALPSYTSDIIDVGILKSGVEHVLPEALTAEEFETAEFIMTDREMEVWEGSYEEDGDVYRLLVTDQALLDSLDEELSVPLIMNYQMSAMEDRHNARIHRDGESCHPVPGSSSSAGIYRGRIRRSRP